MYGIRVDNVNAWCELVINKNLASNKGGAIGGENPAIYVWRTCAPWKQHSVKEVTKVFPFIIEHTYMIHHSNVDLKLTLKDLVTNITRFSSFRPLLYIETISTELAEKYLDALETKTLNDEDDDDAGCGPLTFTAGVCK
mmetsp:Transcript_5234/g.21572  ORF Transcript_5234/g.21572 Transcript_5234/m.21572 type:complete len:139 (-) Transcript_5234:156-572(-)